MLSSVILEQFEKHPYIKVPEELMELLKTQKQVPHINGCGASSGMSAGITPQEIDGVCIIVACMLHDHRYEMGTCYDDKIRADMEFYQNMCMIIINDPSTMTINVCQRQHRFDEALVFFKFVHVYGFKAFAVGKGAKLPDPSFLESLGTDIDIIFKTSMIPIELLGHAAKVKFAAKKMGL